MLIGAAILVLAATFTAAWLVHARELLALRRAVEGLNEGFDRRADIEHERDKSRVAERQIEHEEEGRRALRLDRSLAILADEIQGVRLALLESRLENRAESRAEHRPNPSFGAASSSDVTLPRDTAPSRTVAPPASAPPVLESAVASVYEALADDRPSDGEGQRTTVMMRPDPNLLREAGIPALGLASAKPRARTVQALPPPVLSPSSPPPGSCSTCAGKGRVVTASGLITCAACAGKGTRSAGKGAVPKDS